MPSHAMYYPCIKRQKFNADLFAVRVASSASHSVASSASHSVAIRRYFVLEDFKNLSYHFLPLDSSVILNRCNTHKYRHIL